MSTLDFKVNFQNEPKKYLEDAMQKAIGTGKRYKNNREGFDELKKDAMSIFESKIEMKTIGMDIMVEFN